MDCKERAKKKELERLRWEYWMQSEKFIEMWRFWQSCRENDPSFPQQFQPVVDSKGRKRTHPMLSSTRDYRYYFILRKPEEASFEDYWTFMMSEIWPTVDINEKAIKRVIDYREQISSDIDICVEQFKRSQNREPFINELKDMLINWRMADPGTIYLEITQIDFSATEAKKRIKQVGLILNKRTRHGKPEIKALRKYLEAYRLKKADKKIHYSDIFKIVEGEKVHYADPSRQAKRYVKNANIIIQNLETNKKPWWSLKQNSLGDKL